MLAPCGSAGGGCAHSMWEGVLAPCGKGVLTQCGRVCLLHAAVQGEGVLTQCGSVCSLHAARVCSLNVRGCACSMRQCRGRVCSLNVGGCARSMRQGCAHSMWEGVLALCSSAGGGLASYPGVILLQCMFTLA